MPRCFIAMPVSTSNEHAKVYNDDLHFEHVLVHLIIPAVEKAGYEAIKPIASGADLIHAEIVRQLETADLVMCDISTLNPNVFFELGIRTAVDRPVCIVKDSKTDRIPFDTSIINVHTYESSLSPWLLEDQVHVLVQHLKASAQRSDGRNTLWRYFGLTARAAFKEGQSSLEEKVDLMLLQLNGLEAQVRSASAPKLLRRNAGAPSATNVDPVPEWMSIAADRVQFGMLAKAVAPGIEPDNIRFTPERITVLDLDKKLSDHERSALKELAGLYGLDLYVFGQ